MAAAKKKTCPSHGHDNRAAAGMRKNAKDHAASKAQCRACAAKKRKKK